jgi:hypothetical protein
MTTARTTEGAAVETAIDDLITEITTYLAAGEGGHARARNAVARRVAYRLKQAFDIDVHYMSAANSENSLATAEVDGYGA